MSAWSLFPHLIVRTTGFSYDLLERVRFTRSLAALRKLTQQQAKLTELRANAPRIHRPSGATLAALKAGRPVDTTNLSDPGVFTDWNNVAAEAAGAEREFEKAFEEEGALADVGLQEIAASPRFREAVASSSPPIFQDLERDRWSSRLERQIGSYLQRLCAKNETMSFFGPINYGLCDFNGPDGVDVKWSGPLQLKARRTHLASWLVNGLVEKIAFDPDIAPWLVLRRKGFMDPPVTPKRKRLGEILVRMRILSSQQLEAALALQSIHQKQLGEVLVQQNVATPAQVEEALRLQSGRPPTEASPAEHAHEDAELMARLVKTADGARTLRALAHNLDVPLPHLTTVARIACERRFLTHQLAVAPASHQPLPDLVEHLAGIPGAAARRHLAWLAEIAEGMRIFSAGDAGTKVRANEALRKVSSERWGIGAAAPPPTVKDEQGRETRGEGQHFYVDRLPMREECGGDLRMTLGGARAKEMIERVEPVLELLAEAATRTQVAARKQLAGLLGERRVAFWKVAAAFSDRQLVYDSALSDALAQAVEDPSVPHLPLSTSILPQSQCREDIPVVCSIDILVGAEDAAAWSRGHYQLVVGDTHDTVLVWGWALQFHETRSEVEQEMVRALGALPRSVPVVTALASRRTGLLPSEFPGPVVELGGVSVRAGSWQLPFDDLVVVSDGKTCHLYAESLGSEVYLYNGELESLVHTAFALPRIRSARVDLGAHTPRLTLNGVVLQREQWRLSEKQAAGLLDCKDDKDRMKTALLLWKELGIPDVVFAKLPGERKPVLVDIGSPLLLRVFTNLMQRRGAPLLSEMLPSASQLWLRSEMGRHTSELRCTFLRGVPEAEAPVAAAGPGSGGGGGGT